MPYPAALRDALRDLCKPNTLRGKQTSLIRGRKGGAAKGWQTRQILRLLTKEARHVAD